jgi:hypothetical protein
MLLTAGVGLFAQRPASPQPDRRIVPIKEGTETTTLRSSAPGRFYSNSEFEFELRFPDGWLIAGDDFEEQMRAQGFDLSLKAPDTISGVSRIQVERSLEKVRVLTTAYRAMPGSKDNAILRVAAEDIRANPFIRDAVDYFDLMRSQFAVMRLPADFKYSETQAERLGKMQFAFLDTQTDAGKKRMYATVRGGFAIMFTLSYTKPEDLRSLKEILADGNFALRR